ncbi:hypothetical protein [Bacillus sp. V59.32b]|uniref:hypothetical protein n=1 Tax=Bacillus sp. V59.32b TaxID=1758642 RepID=UPI0010589B7E|nr:hypothetical protein [Bacillus sp. V59.32b]
MAMIICTTNPMNSTTNVAVGKSIYLTSLPEGSIPTPRMSLCTIVTVFLDMTTIKFNQNSVI